ncbi:MAG: Succinyl-diaminopimelate desuccinylase [Anaerolineales bacterium]|nr:Succinyl-diaminopimelate desuccinylase [Anaerolineales bacterium]
MEDVLQIIEERKEVYLDWLVKLCRQPSIAAQNVGMEETANLVEELLQEIGAETQQVPTEGHPVVYGEIGAGEKTLSFYNHYDVQPPEPLDEWDSDPFAAEIRDGTLYARGVSDNKGNIAARLAAVDAYVRARGSLPERVKFIIEGEEEIGSPHLDDFAQANQALIDADACIWEAGYTDPQGRPEVYLGVKGILYVELTAHKANVDLHSMWAPIVPNAAWHLLRALQTLKDHQERVLIDGFYDRVAEPSASDLEALRRMPFNEEGRRTQLGLDAFINDLTGQPLLRQHLFQPTCNICGIWSGYTGEGLKTVLPHEASVKLDFRLVPDQDPHELFDRLVKHLEREGFSDVEIKLLAAEHPARTPTDHPFARLVADTAQEVYEKEPVVYPITPGTGPMYALCQQFGVPAVSIGVGNANSRNHAPNENIHLTDFYRGIAHLVTILDRFSAVEASE